jgi:glycosyltransferase involved in cell wall biosynthesis
MSKEIVIPYPMDGGGIGGVQRVIQGIAENTSDDYEFTILTPKADDYKKNEFFSNVKFREFKKRLSGFGLDYYRPTIKRKMSEYDLIWNHALLTGSVCANVGTPVITTYHGFEHTPKPGLPLDKRRIKDRIKYILMRRGRNYMSDIERIVCVSEYSRNELDHELDTFNTRIYNGTDYLGREFSQSDEEYIFIGDGRNRVKLAELIVEKFDYPVKVLLPSGYVDEKHPNNKIDIISNNPTDEDIINLYKHCSFYVANAYSDTFGITPLEANGFGKFSIVREKRAHEENIVNWENGYRAANTYEMLDAIQQLIENKSKREELNQKAFEYIKGRFTWEKAAERYESEFDSTL